MGAKARLLVVGFVAVVLALGAGAAVHLHPGGDSSRSGTGLTYQGRFYWASGQEVAAAALGPALQQGVPFQDTVADLRRVAGFSPETAVAALLPSLDGSPGGLRWTFLSTDIDRGTDPRGFADSRAVLVPRH